MATWSRASLISPLEAAEAALRERDLRGFEVANIKTVELETPKAKRSLVRGTTEGPHGVELTTWAYADAPDEVDQTLANFMNRLESLTPMDYDSARGTRRPGPW